MDVDFDAVVVVAVTDVDFNATVAVAAVTMICYHKGWLSSRAVKGTDLKATFVAAIQSLIIIWAGALV